MVNVPDYSKIFNELFAEFDKNTDDQLNKEEMVPFLRKLLERVGDPAYYIFN